MNDFFILIKLAVIKMIFKKIWSYLTFKKQDNPSPKGGKNVNLKMMHGINRISIIMFLIGIIFVLIKIFK